MQQNARALAQRHMWLSWWWGMGLILVMVALVIQFNAPSNPTWETVLLYHLVFPFVFLGLPASLGSLARKFFMQWVFRADTLAKLLLRTTIIFEGSVLVLMFFYLCFEVLMLNTSNPNLLVRAQLFFGLSLPWLLSSVAAAWWVRRPGRTLRADVNESEALAQNL